MGYSKHKYPDSTWSKIPRRKAGKISPRTEIWTSATFRYPKRHPGLALSKYAVFQVFLTSSEPQTSLVIIDCITPVFREPSLDPIHFLGSVLSLQRTAYYPRRLLTAF